MSAKTFLECRKGRYLEGMTWREWFRGCLENLYKDGESFSGKRPNGDSGWGYYLETALKRHETSFSEVLREVFGEEQLRKARRCECTQGYCCEQCWQDAAEEDPCQTKGCENPFGHVGEHGPLNNAKRS